MTVLDTVEDYFDQIVLDAYQRAVKYRRNKLALPAVAQVKTADQVISLFNAVPNKKLLQPPLQVAIRKGEFDRLLSLHNELTEQHSRYSQVEFRSNAARVANSLDKSALESNFLALVDSDIINFITSFNQLAQQNFTFIDEKNLFESSFAELFRRSYYEFSAQVNDANEELNPIIAQSMFETAAQSGKTASERINLWRGFLRQRVLRIADEELCPADFIRPVKVCAIKADEHTSSDLPVRTGCCGSMSLTDKNGLCTNCGPVHACNVNSPPGAIMRKKLAERGLQLCPH